MILIGAIFKIKMAALVNWADFVITVLICFLNPTKVGIDIIIMSLGLSQTKVYENAILLYDGHFENGWNA